MKKSKGPCLVPRPEAVTENSTLISCHEYDFCECDVKTAVDTERDRIWNELVGRNADSNEIEDVIFNSPAKESE